MGKQYEVGRWQLGTRYVRLYVETESQDGAVEIFPEDEGTAKIIVGVDQDWETVVATMLHEAYELTLIDLNTRYKCKPSLSVESSDFLFVMTHNQLGEAHERVGAFVAKTIQPMLLIYGKLDAEKKAREKNAKKSLGNKRHAPKAR
jgi:hypothetical protein